MAMILIYVLPAGSPSGDLSGRSVVPEAFSKRSGEIADSLAVIGEAFEQRLDQAPVQDTAGWGTGRDDRGAELGGPGGDALEAGPGAERDRRCPPLSRSDNRKREAVPPVVQL